MRLISSIGEENNQKMTLLLPDGKRFDLIMMYNFHQLGWFASIIYSDKTINNIRVSTSGNFLHQWRNILPFGLACIVEANQEPTLQKDFSSGRAKMYTLGLLEVAAYSRLVSGQTTT